MKDKYNRIREGLNWPQINLIRISHHDYKEEVKNMSKSDTSKD